MSSPISTASCLIIGDEILNAKVTDTNSSYFARSCFELGIGLKRIAVVPDEEPDIVETIRKLASDYDFTVTSGGIGSTHDDITYDAIGKAFGLDVQLHEPTAERMKRLSKSKFAKMDEKTYSAQMRMATLPVGHNVEYLFLLEDSWVPIVSIDSKVFILPGVPHLFARLLDALKLHIQPRLSSDSIRARHFVSTTLPETVIASYLRDLQASVDQQGLDIKIGSYPHLLSRKVTVSIIGPKGMPEKLREIVADVEKNVNGTELSAAEEAELD